MNYLFPDRLDNRDFDIHLASRYRSAQEFLLLTGPEMRFMVNLANSVFSSEIVGAAVDISSVRKSNSVFKSMVVIMFSVVSCGS